MRMGVCACAHIEDTHTCIEHIRVDVCVQIYMCMCITEIYVFAYTVKFVNVQGYISLCTQKYSLCICMKIHVYMVIFACI